MCSTSIPLFQTFLARRSYTSHPEIHRWPRILSTLFWLKKPMLYFTLHSGKLENDRKIENKRLFSTGLFAKVLSIIWAVNGYWNSFARITTSRFFTENGFNSRIELLSFNGSDSKGTQIKIQLSNGVKSETGLTGNGLLSASLDVINVYCEAKP